MRRSTRFMVIGAAALLVSLVAVAAAASNGRGTVSTAPPTADDAPVAARATTGEESPTSPQADVSYAARLPDGQQAVSIRLGAAGGLAGYVAVGDRVNVHAVIDERNDDPAEALSGARPPLVRLTLPDIEVLDVRSPEPGTDATVTYLLAVDGDQAEHIIFLASFEAVWLTLMGEDDSSPSTRGVTYGELL